MSPRLARWMAGVTAALLMAPLATPLTARATNADARPAVITLRHLLWDANQRPLYERCARDFEQLHPQWRIRVQHQGWDDYWMTLSTGFISGTAPDVFTTHVSKFAEFVLNGVLVDLSARIARDGPADDSYEDGLAALWQAQGRRYALPLDWDTVALAVNLDHARRAGVDPAALRQADWNPRDGGRFGQLIRQLTRDVRGRSPDDPGFDRRQVAVYGYQNPGAGGMMGQTEWSHFAVSAGFRFQSRPWDGALRYDDPVLADTLTWLAGLPGQGVSAAPDTLGGLGAEALFLAGRVAVVPAGSWMVRHVARHARFAHAWVPLPAGPTGRRASMRNGLGVSIWQGTRHPDAAWAWVRYVGSAACQARVAEAGVVYPAVKGLAEVAVRAQARAGVDARVFLDTAGGLTFAPPVAPRSAEVSDLVAATLQRVLAGRVTARQALPEMTRRVHAITARP